MKRRDFLKYSMLSLGSAALPELVMEDLKASEAIPPASAKRPNIIIFYADDMGYGDMACQNPDSKIPTPSLDALAKEGVRFTDGHSSSGICTPSRYALLTGRYHWRDFHDIVGPFGPSKFKEGRLTLPEMLKARGYQTACIGKWHLGWDWDAIKRDGAELQKQGDASYYLPDAFDWSKPIPSGPVDHGFDYYFGDDVINFPPYGWIENNRLIEAPTKMLDASVTGKWGNTTIMEGKKIQEGIWGCRPGPMVKGWDWYEDLPTLSKKTVQWVGQRKADQPFFLYFAMPSPHEPIVPSVEFQGKTQAGGYGDYVFQTDWVVGQVLETLKEKGLAENTLVVFTSDNGPEINAFGRLHNYKHSSSGPLRGLKRDIWEGGHRIPFIIRWPGVIRPGRVSNALISQVDLMATFAAIVGFDLPEDAAEDSYNQLPVMLDQQDRITVRSAHVHNTVKDKYAIRKDNWVLIDAVSGHGSKTPDWYFRENGYEETIEMPRGGLFNLEDDISERKNRIDEYPEKATELRQLLKQIREQGHSALR